MVGVGRGGRSCGRKTFGFSTNAADNTNAQQETNTQGQRVAQQNIDVCRIHESGAPRVTGAAVAAMSAVAAAVAAATAAVALDCNQPTNQPTNQGSIIIIVKIKALLDDDEPTS